MRPYELSGRYGDARVEQQADLYTVRWKFWVLTFGDELDARGAAKALAFQGRSPRRLGAQKAEAV